MKSISAFFLIVFSITLISCSEVKMNQQLNLALPLQNINLDPHHMEDIYSMIVNNQIHSSLLQYLPDGTLENDLIDSYKISNDELQYTFKLTDRFFSDGSKITASDVEKSLKRIFFIGASISADLQMIDGYKVFLNSKNTEVLKIKAVDEKTLVINLYRKNPILLKQLATPDTSILKLDDKLNIIDSKISSGAYSVSEENQKHLKLILNKKMPQHNQNPPASILFLKVKSNESMPLAIDEKIDLVSVNSSEIAEIEQLKKKMFREVVAGITHEHYLIFNPNTIPLEWREYLFARFNSNELVTKLGFPNTEAAYGYVPSVLKGAIKSPLLNLPKKTPPKKPLKFEIAYMPDLKNETVLNFLKENWQTSDLTVTQKAYETDKYLDLIFNKKFTAILTAKGLDYPDAMANLSYFKSDIRDNFFMVHDKDVDLKLEECAINSNKDSACFQEIQKMILNKLNVLPLYFGTDRSEYWSAKTKYVPPHPLGLQFLKLHFIEMENR